MKSKTWKEYSEDVLTINEKESKDYLRITLSPRLNDYGKVRTIKLTKSRVKQVRDYIQRWLLQ